MKRLLSSILILCSLASSAHAAKSIRRAAEPIPNEYIVVLKDTVPELVPAVATEMALRGRGRVLRTFKHGLQGFGAELSPAAAQELLGDPRVASIEENGTGHFSYNVEEFLNDDAWHLDRSDQRAPIGLYKAFGWTYDGSGSIRQGPPVDIYVIDTGVQYRHSEFDLNGIDEPLKPRDSRVMTGMNFMYDGYSADNPCGNFADNYATGHGTSVASVAAGKKVGIARGALIVPVMVTNCGQKVPNLLAVVSALDWIINQRITYGRPSVVNMSFFFSAPSQDVNQCVDDEGNVGSCLWAMEQMISELVGRGVPVVTSANNQNRNRCGDQMPARLGYGNAANYGVPGYGRTITVGGTDTLDARFQNTLSETDPGSNFGPCVDLYAPAKQIRSAHVASFTAYRDRTDVQMSSGTSFASPLVAGAIARWLDQFPSMSATDLWLNIKATATPLSSNFDGDDVSANDRLLYIDVYH